MDYWLQPWRGLEYSSVIIIISSSSSSSRSGHAVRHALNRMPCCAIAASPTEDAGVWSGFGLESPQNSRCKLCAGIGSRVGCCASVFRPRPCSPERAAPLSSSSKQRFIVLPVWMMGPAHSCVRHCPCSFLRIYVILSITLWECFTGGKENVGICPWFQSARRGGLMSS